MQEENTLLAKWLAGNISPTELQELQKEYDLSKLEQVLNRQKKFDITTHTDEAMWEDFEKRVANSEKTQKTKKINKNFIIGFILITIFAIGTWFYFNKNSNSSQKIKTPPAKTQEIQYADGTKIHLSPSSSVEYDEQKWTDQRTINLDGQAFFVVEKGNPFVVLTQQGKVCLGNGWFNECAMF